MLTTRQLNLIGTLLRYIRGMSLASAVINLVLGFVVYGAGLSLYRLFLHPLATFPGPKLAGLTYWYECYHDVFKPGQYIFKIIEMHKQYGPIVRVNPNEVHISDPDFYSEIYHHKSYRTDRDAWYNLDFLGEGTAFTTGHELHAQRRQAIADYFSQRSVRALEHRILDVVAAMTARLREVGRAGAVVDLVHVFAAMAMDVVSEYALGKAGSTYKMSHPEFGKDWIDLGKSQMTKHPFHRQFKFVLRIMTCMPPWLVVRLAPLTANYMAWLDGLARQVEVIIQQKKDEERLGLPKDLAREVNVLREALDNPNLAVRDKSISRLKDEANLLLTAGAQTTAEVLARTSFHVLDNPAVLTRLRHEFKTALSSGMPDLTLDTVTKLPYLNAIVQEGLRISFPVLSRSPLIFRDHNLQYKEWTIPLGTAVSQSTYVVSTNPDIFPDPFVFRPERWLKSPGLQKYLVPFSKGRRMCLGVNLAYAEIRLGLACLFWCFDLELYKTTKKDVEVVHDFFVGFADLQSEGIRVRVRGEL